MDNPLYKPCYEVAQERVRTHLTAPLPTESVPLSESRRRVLAETVVAPYSFPQVALSLRDGFAVESREPLGRHAAILTGEELPTWATDVVPSEDWATAHGMLGPAAKTLSRPVIAQVGSEYAAGDTVVARGTLLDHRHAAALAWFGVERVRVHRAPLVHLALYAAEPACRTIAAWLPGFFEAHYAVDVTVRRIAHAAELAAAPSGADLVLVVSDEQPGRYDEIKRLAHGALPGFALDFWKLGLCPIRHVGFGRLGGAPTLLFPDLFFKTVLSALAFLPAVLSAWISRRPLVRKARWTRLPELSYSLPCLVPLCFDDEDRDLRVHATPLRSTFSARDAALAEGYTIVKAPPRLEDTFDALILGRFAPG